MVRLFTQETVEGGDEAVGVLDVEQVLMMLAPGFMCGSAALHR